VALKVDEKLSEQQRDAQEEAGGACDRNKQGG
jgi:hypothetical protein